MKFVIYQQANPNLLVMSVDSSYNPQLTTTESLAMEFNSASDAWAMMINLLNPSGAEFWGSRPKRPK
jgi:hypothetical protein